MRPTQARTPAPRTDQRVLLTLEQVLAELGGPAGPLPRSTWHDWQRKGRGPKVIRLPNGQVRVARDDLNGWLDGLTSDPAAS
ncbi:helix-turn-helix transcriptional regulator [Frankia nepalensis]|uniref:DNA-binding protein n=1 Tax=Frankia nepalensis TaxID=1836974 RepID=A0A937UTG9_9ACTN|nr:DNA-binding protein [Frankia nepalensis]MBL7633572.1 DNA-binding protein [Frankia nepalensis]